MTTVRDILTDALLELGVIDPSETISAGAAKTALRGLNRLVESWANEDLMIVTKDRLTFGLVGGQQSYTIGVGGDFNTTYPVRPGQIDLVSVVVNGVEIPIDVMNDEQWRDVTVKTTPSTFPLQVWANGNYPLNVLYFWPVPTAVNPLVMTVWGQIVDFASINDDVTLPSGYEDALVYNLAVRLAPQYGKEISPITASLAQSSKAMIKRMNWEPTYRSSDGYFSGGMNTIGQRSRGYCID